MARDRRFIGILFIAIALLAGACAAPVHLEEDIDDFRGEIERLQRQLIDEPGDPEALRELGIIHVRTENYAEGNKYLQQAFARDPNDAKTLFYLGLSNELLGRWETALRLYDQDVSRLSRYRNLMRGRAAHLRRLQARQRVVELLAQEGDVAPPTSPRILAVFPLEYQGSDARYAPLGRGLSEMVMTDLANVRSLRLVERVRLQALLDEIELGQSEYVDPQTAPRSGRLLGAGRLIGGNFSVEDRALNVDVAMVSAEDAQTRALETTSGALDQLFELEKQLVFRLVDELDVELTPVEREAIQRVPTRNLQAFLAYSRGLQEEDAGNYGAAARSYGEAAELDPSFEAAADRAETAQGMSATAGTTEEVLSAAVAMEGAPQRPVDLMANRLSILNSTMSGMIVPGEETREPLQDSAPLGEPPGPPTRR